MDRDRGVDSPSGKFDNTSSLSVYLPLYHCISCDFQILPVSLVVATKRDLMSLRYIFFFTVYSLFFILVYLVSMERNMYS